MESNDLAAVRRRLWAAADQLRANSTLLGNSYHDDLHHSAGAFDFVMANPPFNGNGVDKDKLAGDPASRTASPSPTSPTTWESALRLGPQRAGPGRLRHGQLGRRRRPLQAEVLGLGHDYPRVKAPNGDGFVNWLTTHLCHAVGQAAVMRTRARIALHLGHEICRLDVSRSSEPVWARANKQDRVFYVRMNNSTRELPGGELESYLADRWGDGR